MSRIAKPIPLLNQKQVIRFVNSFRVIRSGCWEWKKLTKPASNGRHYPCFQFGRCASYPAHRVSLVIFGVVPPINKSVDHLCKNTLCVNPDHLEIVTIKENILRGDGPAAKNKRKTHCKKGHKLIGYNLIVQSTGKRNCRKCINRLHREYLERQKACVAP